MGDTIKQIDPADIYKPSYSNTKEYILVSAVYKTLSKIDYTSWHKANFNKQKKNETASYSLFDHSEIKLDIKNNRNHISTQTRGDWTAGILLNSWMVNGSLT